MTNKGVPLKDNINVIKEHSNNINTETSNREKVNFAESNVKPNVQDNITNLKETSSDNFNRLKNILDITRMILSKDFLKF